MSMFDFNYQSQKYLDQTNNNIAEISAMDLPAKWKAVFINLCRTSGWKRLPAEERLHTVADRDSNLIADIAFGRKGSIDIMEYLATEATDKQIREVIRFISEEDSMVFRLRTIQHVLMIVKGRSL